MRIYVVQIYIQPGVSYPFSYKFQEWVSTELSAIELEPSKQFLKTYSKEFDITFNLSAKAGLDEVEIRGPAVYKEDKEIEFTIFLPYTEIKIENKSDFVQPLNLFFYGVASSLSKIGIDASRISENSLLLAERVVINEAMFGR